MWQSTAFTEYAIRLWALHIMIELDVDETDNGNAFRDTMDGPGYKLSREENEACSWLGAKFYEVMDEFRVKYGSNQEGQ